MILFGTWQYYGKNLSESIVVFPLRLSRLLRYNTAWTAMGDRRQRLEDSQPNPKNHFMLSLIIFRMCDL